MRTMEVVVTYSDESGKHNSKVFQGITLEKVFELDILQQIIEDQNAGNRMRLYGISITSEPILVDKLEEHVEYLGGGQYEKKGKIL